MIQDYQSCPLYSLDHAFFDSLLDTMVDGTVLDLGANDGKYFPDWEKRDMEIHAFEPVPDMFHKLCHRDRAGRGTWHLIESAVGDSCQPLNNVQVCYAWMLLPNQPLRHVALEYKNTPAFSPRQTTLDWYCGINNVCPSFIKCDVDGYEYRVLRGAINTLRKASLPPIMFEFSHLPQYLGDNIEDMCKLIYDLGYEAASFSGKYRAKSAQDMFDQCPINGSYDLFLLRKET